MSMIILFALAYSVYKLAEIAIKLCWLLLVVTWYLLVMWVYGLAILAVAVSTAIQNLADEAAERADKVFDG